MNVIDAAHATVQRYPGGSESLGPRVGISPAVLRNKVNPNTTSHRLALEEADEIMGVTGDYRILHALAQKHGFALTKLDDTAAAPSITSGVLALNAAIGDLSRSIADAIADGRITPNEMKGIDAAATAGQQMLITLLSSVHVSSGDGRMGAAA